VKLVPYYDRKGKLIGHFPEAAVVWPAGATESQGIEGPRWKEHLRKKTRKKT
jgi:hypothetical protein